MKRLSMRDIMVAAAILVLAGCASKATAPETTTTSQAATGSSVQRAASEQGVKSSDSNSSGSSLDALQKGKPADAGPLKEIYFDFDKYDLRADARATLKANATWLKSNPSARVEIEGHCDERGTNEYNLALGAKRAKAATDYLVSLGIAAERISTISYGEEIPVCKERGEDCYQKNRRARFVVRGAAPTT